MATTNIDNLAQEDSPGSAAVRINQVGMDAPVRWLSAGWRDLKATHFKGVFYGVIFAAMGLIISFIYQTKWQLTMGAIAGFFLMGPFICCGLYALSRQHGLGESVSLGDSLVSWRRNTKSIIFFAAILTFAMIVWARVSLVLFALFSANTFPTLQGLIAQLFSPEHLEFLLVWFGVGFLFASLIFAISVISVPMMLDRDVDALGAVFASFRALMENVGPLYLWAFLIVVIMGLSLVLGFVGLLVTAPIIGHASWHAYRDLIAEPQS